MYKHPSRPLDGLNVQVIEWFRRLRGRHRLDRHAKVTRQPRSFVDFFRSAPTEGQELDLGRKRDSTRTIEW